MRLHGLLGHDEQFGDASVRPSLGHEPEHLALTSREVRQPILHPRPRHGRARVMVDVRPPLASEAFRKALPKENAGEPDAIHQTRADLMDWEYDPSANPEGLDLIKSAQQAAASPGFGSDPLVVLTAGDRAAVTEGLPAPLAATFDGIWMDQQAKLAKLSSKGRQEIVAGATHDLPDEQPDVVVKAIQDVFGDLAG